MSEFRKWECQICNWVYDEEKGCPEDGIAPGTRWEDIPDDWSCPECGVGKEDFEMKVLSTVDNDLVSGSTEQERLRPQQNNDVEPIVIIGSGFAGYQLVKEIRKLDSSIPISMYTNDDGAYYSKPKLSNSISKGVSGHELIISTAEENAIKFDINIYPFSNINGINSSEKFITLESGGQRPFSKLVLATGAKCKTIPVAGNASGEVIQVNSLFDYIKFKTLLANKKRVLIMGAGLIGCEFADDLSSKDYDVTLIDPSSTLLSSLIPEQASRLLEEKLAEQGVNSITKSHAVDISYSDNALLVTLNDGSVVETDVVLSAIGIQPNISLAKQSAIECVSGIKVDSQLQTKQKDIFAMGDCAEVDGRHLPYIAPILHQAVALAKTLLFEDTPVKYPVMPVVIKTNSLPIHCVPKPKGAQGKWAVDADDEDGFAARFIDESESTFGFVLTGNKVNLVKQFSDYLEKG